MPFPAEGALSLLEELAEVLGKPGCGHSENMVSKLMVLLHLTGVVRVAWVQAVAQGDAYELCGVEGSVLIEHR